MRQAGSKSEAQPFVFGLHRWSSAAFLLITIAACAGCQTFSLSEEDFKKQQQGKCADPETGAIVGVAGTVGSLGALIGGGVASAFKK
jgi:hypothetical protein